MLAIVHPIPWRDFGVTSKRGLGARCRDGHEDFGSVFVEPAGCAETTTVNLSGSISGFSLSHALFEENPAVNYVLERVCSAKSSRLVTCFGAELRLLALISS